MRKPGLESATSSGRAPRATKRSAAAPGAKAGHLWQHLAKRLEADLAAGTYRDAGRLPAETVLANQHGVNRHTIRRAIAALVAKGLLRSVPHQGAFLAPVRLSFPLGATTRFSEALGPAGLEPGGRVTSQRRCKPPADVARLLGIAQRTEVIELVTTRTANANPLAYVTTWLPAERFARAAELYAVFGEMRQTLAQMGVANFRRSLARVSSRLADAEELAALGLDEGAYVLAVESVSVDDTGEPTHVSLFRFGADRVDLVVEP